MATNIASKNATLMIFLYVPYQGSIGDKHFVTRGTLVRTAGPRIAVFDIKRRIFMLFFREPEVACGK